MGFGVWKCISWSCLPWNWQPSLGWHITDDDALTTVLWSVGSGIHKHLIDRIKSWAGAPTDMENTVFQYVTEQRQSMSISVQSTSLNIDRLVDCHSVVHVLQCVKDLHRNIRRMTAYLHSTLFVSSRWRIAIAYKIEIHVSPINYTAVWKRFKNASLNWSFMLPGSSSNDCANSMVLSNNKRNNFNWYWYQCGNHNISNARNTVESIPKAVRPCGRRGLHRLWSRNCAWMSSRNRVSKLPV